MPLTAEEEPDIRAALAGPVVFAYSLGLVVATIEAVDPDDVLGDRPGYGIVVGLPEADKVLVGDLTPSGLDRSRAHLVAPPEAEAPPASS
jgi:hypothetical protein